MRNAAVVIEYESNIDETYRIRTDGRIGFRARSVDVEQDAIIEQLLDREYYEGDIIRSFHRTWDTIDDVRRSLACAYEKHRARILTFTDIMIKFEDIGEENLFLVNVTCPDWEADRANLEYLGASYLNAAAKKLMLSFRAAGHKPAIYGFVHLVGVEVNGGFRWQAGMRLLIAGCFWSEIEQAILDTSRDSPRGRICGSINAASLDGDLYEVSDFFPRLVRPKDTSVCTLSLSDQKRRAVWLAQQRFQDMVVCLGFPKGTRENLYSASLEDIVMGCIY